MPTPPFRQSLPFPGSDAVPLAARLLHFLHGLLMVAVRRCRHLASLSPLPSSRSPLVLNPSSHVPRSASGPNNLQGRPENSLKTVSRQPDPLKGVGLARDSSPLHPQPGTRLVTGKAPVEGLAHASRFFVESPHFAWAEIPGTLKTRPRGRRVEARHGSNRT